MAENIIYAKLNDDGFVIGFWQSAAYGENGNRLLPVYGPWPQRDLFGPWPQRNVYGPVPAATEENPEPEAPVIGTENDPDQIPPIIGTEDDLNQKPPIIGYEPNPNCVIPADAIEITQAQFDELYEYQGSRKWVDGQIVVYDPPPPEPAIPDRVSRRQFRLQLIDAGLLEHVEGWVATQDIRTKAAYADSSTFVRSDEMLQQGFAGLGFTVDEVDRFFMEAAGL